jgi:succinyl-diaminopimelate desuccinylase
MAARDDIAARLARRTLQLVDVPSESRNEQEIAELVAAEMPWAPTYRDDETLWFDTSRGSRPLLVLAGHLDTVPAQGNRPGRLEDSRVVGLGASDMKGGLAVMVELARWLADRRDPAAALDVGFLFFPREEIAVEESPLPRLFETGLLDAADLVVVLEPTDNTIQAGCLGNLNARLTFRGVSAHSARPWTGVNAIARAVEVLAPVVRLEPLDVEVQGLVFREVVSVTEIGGGIATNVVPAEATCTLNLRYAPGSTGEQALARVRSLLADDVEVEVLSDSPPARVALDNPLVDRLRAAGGFAVEPKQAWTPVAQFAERGLDAVNLGPGATRYAHRVDEQIESAELARTFEALRRFVEG